MFLVSSTLTVETLPRLRPARTTSARFVPPLASELVAAPSPSLTRESFAAPPLVSPTKQSTIRHHYALNQAAFFSFSGSCNNLVIWSSGVLISVVLVSSTCALQCTSSFLPMQ